MKKNIGRKKCFKIGYTDDIEKRIKTYRTGSNIKLIYYIDIIFDGKQMENCVKNTNRLHQLKMKTDDLCYLSLKQLKDSISICINNFEHHICNCMYCQKTMTLNDIDKHICNKKN